MTESAMQNLYAARVAIGESDFQKAATYYELVYSENPSNLEAEWFYLFGVVTKTITQETVNIYNRLAQNFYPTLSYIASLEEGKTKQSLVYAMIKGFSPLRDILRDAITKAIAIDGRKDIRLEDISELYITKDVDKEKLAEVILKVFGDSEPYCFLAADIWKEMIAERFNWSPYRNFKDKGKELWFDELAKKIKKYDPTYEMPKFKQAGCISSGDAAKVTPGK